MAGSAMAPVMGTLVLIVMTGLTVTNHHRNQNTATGKSLSGEEAHVNAQELERELALEDAALMASYERFQRHPKNVQGGGAAPRDGDPMMVNSVYSFNTKSELKVDEEFVVRDLSGGGEITGPRTVTTTAAPTTTGGGGEDSDWTTTEADGVSIPEGPIDFYDPNLTVSQKRDYVKKVVYFFCSVIAAIVVF